MAGDTSGAGSAAKDCVIGSASMKQRMPSAGSARHSRRSSSPRSGVSRLLTGHNAGSGG
jgi:hypothetical protein